MSARCRHAASAHHDRAAWRVGRSLSAADGWGRWSAVGAVTSGVPAAEDDAPHPSTLSPALGALLGFRVGGLSGLLPLGRRPLRSFPLCLCCCGLLLRGSRGRLRLSTSTLGRLLSG